MKARSGRCVVYQHYILTAGSNMKEENLKAFVPLGSKTLKKVLII